MLQVHHFVEWFLQPPVNGVILFIIFLLLSVIFRKPSYKFILIIGLISSFLTYIQYTPIFARFLTSLIYPTFSSVNCQIQSVKHNGLYVVVLGAGTGIGVDLLGRLEAISAGQTLYNIDRAYQVIKNTPDIPILLSGGVTGSFGSEAQAMANYLYDKGVSNRIFLENRSLDTDENALYAAEILSQMNVKHILLITQASHMWRSKALFEKNKIQVIVCPYWDEYEFLSLNWYDGFLINAGAYSQVTKLLHEVIGYIVYVLF